MHPPVSFSRRKFLGLIGVLSAAGMSAKHSLAQSADADESLDDLLSKPILPEAQAGDPLREGDKFETLTLVSPGKQKAVGDDPIFPKKDAKDLAEQMLTITRRFADEDVSRHHKASQVIEFLNVLDFNDVDVPFCAAGVTYAACRAYCDIKVAEKYDENKITDERTNLFKSKLTTINAHYFFPSASVRIIKAAAIKQGRWMTRNMLPLPGWLVVFSWDGTSLGNHIGLVESAKQGENFITTLEYNTSDPTGHDQRNGGHVARKTRPLGNHILGYVKIHNSA